MSADRVDYVIGDYGWDANVETPSTRQKGVGMYPGKDYCAICNGVSEEWDCSLQGGLLCNPGRKAEPQYIDFDTRAKAAGYVKLEPGQVVVDKALHELALSMAHKWEQHIEGRVCASQEARDE